MYVRLGEQERERVQRRENGTNLEEKWHKHLRVLAEAGLSVAGWFEIVAHRGRQQDVEALPLC